MTDTARREELDAALINVLSRVEGRLTEFMSTFRGLVLNNAPFAGLVVLDGNGQWTKTFTAPFAGVAIANLTTGVITVANAPPAIAAPAFGTGVTQIGSGFARTKTMTGTVLTIYGPAGATVDVTVFDKPPAPTFGPISPAASTSQAVPGFTRIEDGTSQNLAQVGSLHTADANAVPGNIALLVDELALIFNGATFDRQRALGSAGDGLGVSLSSPPSSTPGAAAPAANTAAVVTFAGVAGQRHRLTFLELGVGGTAPNSVVATVSDGTTTYTFDLTAALQASNVPLPAGGVQFAVGAALTITVPAAGATALSRVNAAKITS